MCVCVCVCVCIYHLPHGYIYIYMYMYMYIHIKINVLPGWRNNKYANDTELSKHIWKLKENNRKFNISWSIVKQVAAYKTRSK